MGVDLSDTEAVASLTPEQLQQVDESYAAFQLATNDAFAALGDFGEAECADFVPDG